METISVKHNEIPQPVLESINAIVDWGHSLIVISGRVYTIEGDIQMADQFQSNDEHYIEGKDITAYITQHAVHLSRNQNQNEFSTYINQDMKRRVFRFHKDEKYARFAAS